MSPGPTVNVLGEHGGQEIIEVTGHQTYRDDGQLRMTTVSVTSPTRRISLGRGDGGLVRPDPGGLPARRGLPAHADGAAGRAAEQRGDDHLPGHRGRRGTEGARATTPKTAIEVLAVTPARRRTAS